MPEKLPKTNISQFVAPASALNGPVLLPQGLEMVSLTDPEGAYYTTEGTLVQVIVVGPMRFAPVQYERAVSDLKGEKHVIVLLAVMDCFKPQDNLHVMRRGFFRMQFAPERIQKAQPVESVTDYEAKRDFN